MSAIWVQKMTTYFKRIDFDHDGVLTRKDFEAMAIRFIESGRLDEKAATDIKTTMTAVWDKYLSTVGGGDSITLESFIESMKKLVHDPSLKATVEGPLPLFFHAVDSDRDGNISATEYADFFKILGLDPGLADATFKAIDTNNDGLLSLDEFKTAGSDFFIAENDGNSSLFWGPLV